MSRAAATFETAGAALARGRAMLRAAGIDSAALDARLLLAAALEVDMTRLIAAPEQPLLRAAAARFDVLLGRRLAREPMAHILGRREFWSLDFAVTRETLTPRPDTETLVAAALEAVADRQAPLRILDLGTGTGCILLALLHDLARATGIGVDHSGAALAVAERNAAALGMATRARFCLGDWGRGLSGAFDLIVSNPPYIATSDLATLPPEVRCEPMLALDGGIDGLAAYRALAPDAVRLLQPHGTVLVEFGQGQGAAVEAVLHAAGLAPVARHKDLAGIERCIAARLSPSNG